MLPISIDSAYPCSSCARIIFVFGLYIYIYIHKSYDTNLQYWQKLHTTILLERYPREQTTMTTPGPFKHKLKTTVVLNSDATSMPVKRNNWRLVWDIIGF